MIQVTMGAARSCHVRAMNVAAKSPEVARPEAKPAPRALLDPPGGVLMWLIVALELAVFAMLFGIVAILRGEDPAAFAEMHAALDPRFGLFLTVLLLTSGGLVAEGVHAFRANDVRRARRFHTAGVLVGTGFVAVKLWDFTEKARAGHWFGASDLWDAYVLATGFHFAHVVVAVVLLAFIAVRMGGKPFDDAETAVAGTALFWHMCDVAWIILFPLFFVA